MRTITLGDDAEFAELEEAFADLEDYLDYLDDPYPNDYTDKVGSKARPSQQEIHAHIRQNLHYIGGILESGDSLSVKTARNVGAKECIQKT